MPFFSVIIPLHNKASYIKNTVESALNQDYTDYEIIIVNDGSTDDSLSIIEELKDKKITIYNTPNKGVSHARNFGINLAKGPYIALLDADDYWYNSHLEELAKSITLFPNADLYSNNYEIQYKSNFIKPAKFSLDYKDFPIIVNDYFKSSRINSIVWTSSSCFTKRSFKNIGGFKTDLRTGQDIDLWIRYALHYKIVFNPSITMLYNYQSAGLSKSNYNIDRYKLIDSYQKEELINTSLKEYLDLTRYAVVIRCKINRDKELYKTLMKEIDLKNINIYQRITLYIPSRVLTIFKKLHSALINNKIYLSTFK